MNNVIHFPATTLPADEPVTVLIDANVKAVKLFKALAEGGFVFTFDRHVAVLRISESSTQ